MIERLERELAELQHEMRTKHPRKNSNAYQLLLSRQNRILGALAAIKGEQVWWISVRNVN